MKHPTFLEGVALALVAATSGTILFNALNLILPSDTILRLLISLFTLVYIGYLLSRSRERLGRISVFGAWIIATVTSVLLSPTLFVFLLLHCGFIWIVRSLYIHNGALSALTDLALNALSLAAAVWATVQTGNLFLTIWCFFLAQALFVTIPKGWPGKQAREKLVEDDFAQAYQAAQKALSKLVSNQ